MINSQPYRSGTSFKNAYTGTRKSTTLDFDLLVSYQLTNHSRSLSKLKSTAHGDLTCHAAVSSNLKNLEDEL